MGVLPPPAASHMAGNGDVTDRKRRRDRVLLLFRAISVRAPSLSFIEAGDAVVKRAKALKTGPKSPFKAKREALK